MAQKLKVTSRKTTNEISELLETIRRLECRENGPKRDLEAARSWLDEPIERGECEKANQKQRLERATKTLDDIEKEKETCREQIRTLKDTLLQPLSKELDDINGRAALHTMGAEDVQSLANEAEGILAVRGVSQKCRIGAEFEFRPAGKEASNSYARKAGPRITTRVRLQRVTDGWRLIEAQRDKSWVNQSSLWRLTVSPAAKANIVATAMKGIFVKESRRA